MNPGFTRLFTFVHERVSEEVHAAQRRSDGLGLGHAQASLRVLDALGRDLVDDPRHAPEVLGYLRRAARRHRHHPDYPTLEAG
ncbi:MAG: hypothetical protein ACXVW4_15060 [Nocardioides sp.]